VLSRILGGARQLYPLVLIEINNTHVEALAVETRLQHQRSDSPISYLLRHLFWQLNSSRERDDMTKRWNPRTEPPEETTAYIQWLADDMALFRSEHPELPQGRALKARDLKKVIRAWNDAREVAEAEDAEKVSPEWGEAVRKFHRTRTITFPLTKKKPRKSHVTKIILKRDV
jgi:hypothetical protein